MGDETSIDNQENPEAPTAPLHAWERSVAFLAGVLALVVGGAATFNADSDAATSVMLIIGAAFVLVGIQGTPLIRVGGDKASFEMERRRRVRAQRVVDEISRTETPEIADQVIEAVARVEPSIDMYAQRRRQQVNFKREVRDAIRFITRGWSITEATPEGPLDYDFLVHGDGPRDVRVILRWFNSDPEADNWLAKEGASIHRRITDLDACPLVIVVNRTTARIIKRQYLPSESLVIAPWGGSNDDLQLVRIIEELMRTPPPTT